jgi:flagellar biosynthesis protein FlhB
VSRALSAAAALAAALVVLAWDAPALVAHAASTLREALSAAVAGGGGPRAAGALAAALALRAAGPPLAALVVVGLVVGLAQTRGLVLAPVRFDLGRIASPAARGGGLDGRGLAAAGKGLLEVALLAGVALLALRPVVPALAALTGAPAARTLAALGGLSGRLAARLAAACLALGAVDALLAARRHRRGLRMTRDEAERERREVEGDPAHRRERQRLRREALEQPAAAAIREAGFLVVDPGHTAVALRYAPTGDAAPVVVARGERLVAARLEQLAREAGLPVFQDVALARALGGLAPGAEIPPALYEGVAEILRDWRQL